MMKHTENNTKTTLITGATGFVGSHLVRRLANQGWRVHIIARPDSNLAPLKEAVGSVTVHRYDGTIKNMLAIVEASKPSVVFHLASLFLSQHQHADIDRLIESNILFSTQLTEAMVANNIFLLINTGTSWQHFENKPYSPVCLYAATKQAYESILQFYVETAMLKVITLKLFDTYGPDDFRPKLFSLLTKNAVGQQTLDMSPGEQMVDFVYIDDVIDAYVLAAHRLQTEMVAGHEQYAVSSGAPVKLKQVVMTYNRICGNKLKINWGGRPYRPREVMTTWTKGPMLPGWSPKIGLEEGIKKTEAEVKI